jgi:hypothetical protein
LGWVALVTPAVFAAGAFPNPITAVTIRELIKEPAAKTAGVTRATTGDLKNAKLSR